MDALAQGKTERRPEIHTRVVPPVAGEGTQKVKTHLGEDAWRAGRYEEGARLFDQIATGDYVDFLTLPAYDRITRDAEADAVKAT